MVAEVGQELPQGFDARGGQRLVQSLLGQPVDHRGVARELTKFRQLGLDPAIAAHTAGFLDRIQRRTVRVEIHQLGVTVQRGGPFARLLQPGRHQPHVGSPLFRAVE